MKDAVSRVLSCENPASGTRVSVGDAGQRVMCDVKEMDDEDDEQGGGTRRGVNMTSICGSLRTEVEMVWYRSWFAGDMD